MSCPQVIKLFATTAWHIWLHQNKTRIQKHTVPLGMIRDVACNFLQIFKQTLDYPCSRKPTQPRWRRRWKPLNPGEYKIKFDWAMFNESGEAGIGVVVRDSSGQVIAALAKKVGKPCNSELLEMLVARWAVIFATEIGIHQPHFEGDSETIIKALQRRTLFSSSFGHLVQETLVHANSLRSFSLSHCSVRKYGCTCLSQRARLFFPLLV